MVNVGYYTWPWGQTPRTENCYLRTGGCYVRTEDHYLRTDDCYLRVKDCCLTPNPEDWLSGPPYKWHPQISCTILGFLFQVPSMVEKFRSAVLATWSEISSLPQINYNVMCYVSAISVHWCVTVILTITYILRSWTIKGMEGRVGGEGKINILWFWAIYLFVLILSNGFYHEYYSRCYYQVKPCFLVK